MVEAVEDDRIMDVRGDAVLVNIDNTYVLPFNVLKYFTSNNLLTIDVDAFSKTIQGEAFLAMRNEEPADLVLVNRKKGGLLSLRVLDGYRVYYLFQDGKNVAVFTKLGLVATSASNLKLNKEAVSKLLKLKGMKFKTSEIETEAIKKELFGN